MMKILIKISLLFSLSALLIACQGSKEPTFYVLNPMLFQGKAAKHPSILRIGISTVTLPGYLDHPQLILFSTSNHGELLEHHQWAEPLTDNVRRVIQTNLSQKLRGSAVQLPPWDADFHPQYYLRVDISQFKIDLQGNALLQAIYYIEDQQKVVYQAHIQLHEKLAQVSPPALVGCMNHLLAQLIENIAHNFAKIYSQ